MAVRRGRNPAPARRVASHSAASAVVVCVAFLLSALSVIPRGHGFLLPRQHCSVGTRRSSSPESPPPAATPPIAPELSEERKNHAREILDKVFGEEDSGTWDERRDAARATSATTNEDDDEEEAARLLLLENIPEHELVYGELGIEALATILDAVGVRKGDVFLDIGSGDGLLVIGAALLYPDHLEASRGVEIVPKLYQRSLEFADRFSEVRLGNDNSNDNSNDNNHNDASSACGGLPEISFGLGNIYEPARSRDGASLPTNSTTIAVCFATTWSKNIPGKKLDRLSEALGRNGCSELPVGARVVVIDGVLNHQTDGYSYEGELRLHCPDTAPYSVARLYTRT